MGGQLMEGRRHAQTFEVLLGTSTNDEVTRAHERIEPPCLLEIRLQRRPRAEDPKWIPFAVQENHVAGEFSQRRKVPVLIE
ncbi:hypothetical protein ACFPRL_22945 [Pseudoclavibacter helvolus]